MQRSKTCRFSLPPLSTSTKQQPCWQTANEIYRSISKKSRHDDKKTPRKIENTLHTNVTYSCVYKFVRVFRLFFSLFWVCLYFVLLGDRQRPERIILWFRSIGFVHSKMFCISFTFGAALFLSPARREHTAQKSLLSKTEKKQKFQRNYRLSRTKIWSLLTLNSRKVEIAFLFYFILFVLSSKNSMLSVHSQKIQNQKRKFYQLQSK